jgi:hypothetical protein
MGIQASVDKPSATLTDLEYAIQLIMTGKQDPEFAARVQAEREKITGEVHKRHGVLNVAVDLVREARDEAEIRVGQQPANSLYRAGHAPRFAK